MPPVRPSLTLNLDSIRSQAKRAAWHGDDNVVTRFVPYANRHGHNRSYSSRSTDLERLNTSSPLGHTESAPVVTNNQHGNVDGDAHLTRPPNRARTMPDPPSAISEEPSSSDSRTPFHASKQSTATNSDTLTTGQSDDANNLRKRHHLFGHKKSEEDDEKPAELAKSSTAESKKSRNTKMKQKIPVGQQIKAVFLTWPNLLLICVPVGIALNYVGVNPLAVFVVNFLAIVPLAGLLSFATEEIAMRVGETLGGLLNASFGNATELIVAVIALVKGEILIVQTSLIGSMLSNLLLVMGMCFFFGGWNKVEQFFNTTVAMTACSLLFLATGSLIIPTVYVQWSQSDNARSENTVPALSRGTAIILLFVYFCYLFFQLKTHNSMFNEPSAKAERRTPVKEKSKEKSPFKSMAQIGANNATTGIGNNDPPVPLEEAEEEEEDPKLTWVGGLVTLVGATALIGLCSEFVVDSINAVTTDYHVSPEFVGLILLPIVGNAAEHATAVTVAIKDKMDLAIGVAVGSSMQIALLVIPLAVVIGWIVGPVTPPPPAVAEGVMTLNFDGFVIAVLFVAVLLVNYLIQDGKSHWLEGVMLMTTYIIIAVAAWFYPTTQSVAG